MNIECGPIDTVYLLGWEYNRLLDPDPTQSARPSGLPADALWGRGSFFWLFKRVMCPQAAYDGDVAAKEELGWTSGQIFSDLKEFGAVELFDLNKDLTHGERADLQASSFALTPLFDRNRLFDATKNDEITLERVKHAMYGPVLAGRGWSPIPAPKSVSHWYPDASTSSTPDSAIHNLAQLFEKGAASPILLPPKKLVTHRELLEQQKEEEKTQKPLISALLLGELSQADYMKEVAKGDLSKYEPLNAAMLKAWNDRKDLLRRLRDAAQHDLWPLLHNDWLPQIAQDPQNLNKFAHHIQIAIRRVEEKANAGAVNVRRDSSFVGGIALVTFTMTVLMQKLGVDTTIIAPAVTAMTAALFANKPLLTTRVDELVLSEKKRRGIESITAFFQNTREQGMKPGE